MLDQMRDQMRAYLAGHCVGVLSTGRRERAWAIPVHYRADGLEMDCLVPRWADVLYYLEQDPGVLFVIQSGQTKVWEPLRWLEVHGTARLVERPDWTTLLPEWSYATPPGEIYQIVHITPQHIDLFDESRGWGVQETLELS